MSSVVPPTATAGTGPVPLHAPESIQTFGYLLAFRRSDGLLERCSANIAELLGRPPSTLTGQDPAELLSPGIAELVATTQPAPSGGTLLREPFVAADGAPYSVTVLRTPDHLILELEPADDPPDAIYELICRTQAGVEVLRHIADPATMMARIARLFRDITGFDRVLLFRFDHDWNRDVVAEERSPVAVGRFLGLRVPADALPAVARRLYQRAGTRLIPDIHLPTVPIVGLPGRVAGDAPPLDLSDSCLRSTSIEHTEHLRRLGVRASLTMAIEVAGHLWGMVTAHHYQPRRQSAIRRAACRLLATSIAAPLAAIEDTARADAGARRAIETARAAGEAVDRGEAGGSALAHFVERLGEIAEATGVLVRMGPRETVSGTLPGRAILDRILALAAVSGDGGIFSTESLSRADPMLAAVRDIASGAVAVDLPVPGGGQMLLLRGEIVEDVVWVGGPAEPSTDSGPAWAAGDAGSGPRVERTRGVAREWPERLLPLLPLARQTILDIARLAAEREALAIIRRRESELRTIYDSVDEGIALVDGDGRILNCNQRFAALAGLGEANAVGRRLDDLLAAAGPARLLDAGRAKGHARLVPEGDSTLEIRATATGRGPGALHTIVVRDIAPRERFEAELVRAREAAERANRAKDEFLSNMSHELRTPLTAVLGYIDLLDQQIRDPTQRKWIATIRRSGWSLLRLLSDVVDFARIDAGEIRLEFGVLDPVGKVHSIIDLFRPAMEEKGVRCEVAVAPGVPRAVTGDAARLRQVLSNLIGNAAKFTAEGTVRVTVEADAPDADGHVALTFTVADTGVGIAADKLPVLFDRFSQADTSSTRAFGGAGLGLAIARGLARRMGGDVTAESAGPGRGATFRLRLPFRPATRQGTSPPARAAQPQARGAVLIIEDDPVNQELLAEMTRVLGFSPEVASTGEEGVAAAAAHPGLAAILVDVNLPGMNGLDAIRRIRALPSSVARAPILCVTALSSERDRAAALAAGADAYLGKPVRLADLRQALEREMAKPAAGA